MTTAVLADGAVIMVGVYIGHPEDQAWAIFCLGLPECLPIDACPEVVPGATAVATASR